MSLRAIQTDVHSLILNARRIERLIKTPAFEVFYNNLTCVERKEADYLIKTLDYDKVSVWFDNKLIKEVGELSYRELRTKASRLCIPGYSLLDKEQLVREIIRVQNEQRRDDRRDNHEVGPSGKMESDSSTGVAEIPQAIGPGQTGAISTIAPMVHGIALSAVAGSPCVS